MSGLNISRSAVDAADPPTSIGKLLSGLHDIEPDFADGGIWVERRLRISLPRAPSSIVRVTGQYFPKLISAQNGSGDTRLSFFVCGEEIHAATLRKHGLFTLEFPIEAVQGDDAEILVASDRCFVPAQIGDGSDQRELCWRLQSLRIGNISVFDCRRQFNFFFERNILTGTSDASSGLASFRFHLDAPFTGSVDGRHTGFVISGWGFDLASSRAARVRVVIGQKILRPQAVDRPDVQSAFPDSALPLATGFSIFVAPPVGILPVRIEVLTNGGDWTARHRGFVVSAPANDRVLGGKVAEWLVRALPLAVRSRTLDHFRVMAKGPSEAQLMGMFRFHLDTPRVDRTNVFNAECVVSGWAFDEQVREAVPVRAVVGKTVFLAHAKHRPDVQKAFGASGPLLLNTGFACVLTLPVGFHRMRVEVQGPNGDWFAVRRARLLRLPDLLRKSRAPVLSLHVYRKLQNNQQNRELPELVRHMEVMLIKPLFLVVIDARSADDHELSTTLASIQQQIYRRFEMRIIAANGRRVPLLSESGIQAQGVSLRESDGDYVIFLRSGQQLARRALYEFASAVNHSPEIDLIYADETVKAQGDTEPVPFYKPDWSPDYLEAFNYIGFPACYRTSLAAKCIGNVQTMSAYDFILNFTECTTRILHLPLILAHDPFERGAASAGHAEVEQHSAALKERLVRTGRRGMVAEHPVHKGCFSISLQLARAPLVSIVIPTAGKTITLDERQIDLIVNVIEQIRHRSSYQNVEIVVVDNGDLSAAQIAMLKQAGCKRTTYTEPIFNISKKLNQGVRHATGELLLLMNDDIEILTPDWIDRMVAHFEKPHAGVVGAKLLYPDGSTQHVGVVHNSGNPDHVRRMCPRDESGYFFSTCGVRNFCAVTGACMMVRADNYRAVGGYTEDLAVSYNDVDFCLKVGELGLSIIYSPDVELTHMESQSRVASADPKEVGWYHARWAAQIVQDRFYNERFLSVAPPTFVPCINERLV